jgi:mannose-6-phosphate isomerase-like protein (cupin superfamily)
MYAFFRGQGRVASPAMEGQVYPLAELRRQLADANDLYTEFLRIDTMSAGLYALPANATDPQTPHNEDEIYYVIKGRASIEIAGTTQEVEPGTVIFVAKHIDHHFQDIKEDLEVLVLFAPAETEP